MSNETKPARVIAVMDKDGSILMGIEFDDVRVLQGLNSQRLDVLLYPGLAEMLAKHIITDEHVKTIIERSERLEAERDMAIDRIRALRDKILAVQTAEVELRAAVSVVPK